jgi:outer membrane receptor protein involved in Fe transport
VDVRANGNHVLEFDELASNVSPLVSVSNTFARPVSTHFGSHVVLHTRRADLTLGVSYVGRYSNDEVIPSVPIASWITMDATVGIPLRRLFPALAEGSFIQFALKNALNREPPYAWNPLVPVGYDPVNANAMGRTIGIRIVVKS